MNKLMSILVIVVSFVFLTGCAANKSVVVSAAQGASKSSPSASPYFPDTSGINGCALNAVDLQDTSKYEIVRALRFQNMLITYYLGVNGTTPQYVSMLVDMPRQKTVGIAYYDNGEFKLWIMQPGESEFKKHKVSHELNLIFQKDFEGMFGIEFPVGQAA